ncbi:MAG: aldo/keto reductase [Verrucomicrobia bacterium]|nr:aldo/keto reductase [Verrucomicrobiota bacterium]
MDRRNFIKTAAALGFTSSIVPALAQQKEAAPTGGTETGTGLPRATDPGERRGEMLYRVLGRTGEHVSAIGLGGSHIAKPAVPASESIRLIHEAIDRGINFMDNSWDYNEGQSEMRMGQALSEGQYRDRAFLMTKIDGRTKEEAARQIETSLERLKTDRIDLLQHHEILRFDDPDRIFAEDGAMEAFLDAKKAGKIRYIGFTGHKDPRIHLYMLETARRHGFHFDTVQMPLNVMDAHFRSFAQLVLPELVRDQIGALGMKAFGGADGIILKSKVVEPLDCLHYSLNLPTSVVITGIDNQKVLDQAFAAVKTFQLMDEQQLAALLEKTRPVAMAGMYELFKTTSHFDTTAKHPDWLGGDTPAVQQLAPQNAG